MKEYYKVLCCSQPKNGKEHNFFPGLIGGDFESESQALMYIENLKQFDLVKDTLNIYFKIEKFYKLSN